jgi:hypothetical protein
VLYYLLPLLVISVTYVVLGKRAKNLRKRNEQPVDTQLG